MSFFFSPKDCQYIIQNLFLPNEIYEAIEEIDLEKLYEKGYRTVFLDVDNTILTYEQREVPLDKLSWIQKVKGIGFRVFLISNNSGKRRIQRIAKQLQMIGVYFALKPSTLAVRELADDHFVDLTKTIFIGDQLLKDVVAGNWVKAHTILVNPIDIRNSLLKTVQREIELFLLKKLQ